MYLQTLSCSVTEMLLDGINFFEINGFQKQPYNKQAFHAYSVPRDDEEDMRLALPRFYCALSSPTPFLYGGF